MKKIRGTFAVSTFLIVAFSNSAPCLAQSGGVPNFGFHSYCGSRQGGISGYSRNNSLNSGLGGFSQTSNQYSSPSYSTERSTKAAQDLARQVSYIASQTPVGRAMANPQAMAQFQQSMNAPGPPTGGLLQPTSKSEMLRVFLEGGTPQNYGNNAPAPSGTSSNGAASSTAYNNYQLAQNEATKARNAAQRVRNYDRDTWSRKNDASQAEYAANNANYAAQRAESAAYNGDSQARGYANLARQAANRARADANQARYNANTMH